ncbi:hypothetical protein QKW51_18440 [Xenophilus aerolatus]|nr:hypothetical protein [Xenophilus aerolatus]
MSVCHVAQACKPTLTTVLVFEEGSASLGRDQIALLAVRLDHFRRTYPHLDEVDIEGVARNTAPDARQLAHRRAAEAAHAVRALFNGVKLHVSSNVYPPELSIHAGNYAGIDVVPPMKDMPDCAPVPIRDFKR